jgi:ribosomal protein S18 acetylase RimI-like enzyme
VETSLSVLCVRAAEMADQEQVLALARDFATSFAVDPDAFRRTFAQLLDRSDTRLIVAVAGHEPKEIIGYLLGFTHPTFYANGGVAWVEEVAVRESCRREGVGTALMREFEDRAAAHGARLVALATRRAAPFYRALGYEDSATYFRRQL